MHKRKVREENEKYMRAALKEAYKAYKKDEVPVGAVIVKNGEIIARAHNQVEKKGSTLFHAEILAIRKACKKTGNKYLDDCIIYVTLEPCVMCSGAIINSRISRVVYGADEEKTGTAGTILNLLQFPGFSHFVHITPNILPEESIALLKAFFETKRK